ncbi:hypothetical protein HBH70_012500 [Parastagonospora nodorum]|nr:hypothetical protein HBH75_040800 [Parastagonospora nodorum]KAH5151909.1 hypothetical protein HBH70_012500 [Parastagonospora nodorum]KAH6240004.1 hypothetical protein HBI15_019960 [Parastagonospora nodorum]
MKFQIFTAALYASLALASAIPQPPVGGVSALEARGVDIDNKPEEDWVCPGKDGKTVTYKKNEINAAITKGVELAKDGKQVSNGNDNPFPSPIGTPSSLPGIPDKYKDAKNVQHFPMKNGKGAFNGQRPAKPERVMYLHSGDSDDAEFIGLWTHEGAAKGQFLQCREKDD